MAEQASALLALWNDVDPALEAEYNAWHAGEHVPERLTIPGIVWGRRYVAAGEVLDGPRYLTLYGLRDLDVLSSAPYQRLLDQPTPWSRRMRPALRNISRWACELRLERRSGDWPLMQVLCFEDLPGGFEDRLRRPDPDAGGFLVAQRAPSAPGLPWLAGGQAKEVSGDALLCLESAGRAAFDGESPTYRQTFRLC